MPCDSVRLNRIQEERKAKALADLARQIELGEVSVQNVAGEATLVGWETDREGPGHWHDDCAIRTLMAEGSAEVRLQLSQQMEQQGFVTN